MRVLTLLGTKQLSVWSKTCLGIVSEERGDSISMCCNKAAWGSAAGFSHLQFSFCDSCPQNSLFHTHSPYNIAIKGLRCSSAVLSMVRQCIQSHTQFITGYKKFCSLIKPLPKVGNRETPNYFFGSTDESPMTGLNAVPGAISWRADTAAWRRKTATPTWTTEKSYSCDCEQILEKQF